MALGVLFLAVGALGIAAGFTNRDRQRQQDFEREVDFKIAEVRYSRARLSPIFGAVFLLMGLGIVVASVR